MFKRNDPERAVDALNAIPPTIDHDIRARVGMAAKDAGVPFDAYDAWQMDNPRYDAAEVRSMWNSYKPGPVKAGTLFKIAADYEQQINSDKSSGKPIHMASTRLAYPLRKPARAAQVLSCCGLATNEHPYIIRKHATGVPLDALRVVPASGELRIAGASVAGYLVVPATAPDGTLQSLQFIPPIGGKKLNLPGASMAGASFAVGELVPGGWVYVVEGIGQAWACWQAVGGAAVVCFGAGNMRRVAAELRQKDSSARLVLVPDVGKEKQAAAIAVEVQGQFVSMPQGWEQNSDVNDLAQRDGLDALKLLLQSASMPPKPELRYKLLSRTDLAALQPLQWRIRGVLPAVGLACLYGPSASGKSFLSFDMAAAIAEGRRWFGYRVELAPVVYVALEGEAGFKLRAQAWEAYAGRKLTEGLTVVMQPFKLCEPQDVRDLAAVVPAGAVVFLDTLNRAAPTSDENSSSHMGEILEAAKRLQNLSGGLVTLIHHTGKEASKGPRGHSSLFAAVDSAVEVSATGGRRVWKIAKAKDGADGDEHPFRLEVMALGNDEYGEPLTSCAIASNDMEGASRKKLLRESQKQSIAAYAQACENGWGELDADGKFFGLHLEKWRGFYYQLNTARNQEAKRKSFERSRKALLQDGMVIALNDVYRVTDPSTSMHEPEFEQATLSRATGQPGNRTTGQSRDIDRKCPGQIPGQTGHTSIDVSQCPDGQVWKKVPTRFLRNDVVTQ